MKGYKAFNSDWTCRGFQYRVGETYEMNSEPKICRTGFHLCKNPVDCFRHYGFWEDCKIAEIEALGEISEQHTEYDSKCCTNKIKIVKELSLQDAKIEIENKWTLSFLVHLIPQPLFHEIKKVDIINNLYINIDVIKSIAFKEEGYKVHYGKIQRNTM